MENGDKSAFPADAERLRGTDLGLTKREYFAIRAMQGLLAAAAEPVNFGAHEYATAAVIHADYLLAALDKHR
jgi:hypothetical protein